MPDKSGGKRGATGGDQLWASHPRHSGGATQDIGPSITASGDRRTDDRSAPGDEAVVAPSGGKAPSSLLRNTIAQTAPMALGYVLSFASAPIVLTGLGLRQFGIWALTGALAQYGSLLDLGVGRSVSRFVAAHHTDRRLCGEYVALGLGATAVVAALVTILAVGIAGPVSAAIGGISEGQMRIVLLASSVIMVAGMVSNVIASYPVGLREMVTPNMGLTFGVIVNFAASVGAIVGGAGLIGYALANAASALLGTVAVLILVVRFHGPLPVSRTTGRTAKGFLSYATKSQLVRAMELVNYQSDKIVIALFIGPAQAGAYELANRAAAAARQFGVYPTTALVPTLAAQIRVGGISEIRRQYGRFTELTVTAAFPALVLTGAAAPLLLLAWLGAVGHDADIVLLALSVAYIFNVSSGVGFGIASAAGDPTIGAVVGVATAVVNIVLTAGLAPVFGVPGVLIGTVIALTGGAIVQVWLIGRRFGLPMAEYSKAIRRPLEVSVALAVPVAALSYSGLISGRPVAAVSVVLLGFGYMAVYLTWAAKTKRLPRQIVARLSAASGKFGRSRTRDVREAPSVH